MKRKRLWGKSWYRRVLFHGFPANPAPEWAFAYHEYEITAEGIAIIHQADYEVIIISEQEVICTKTRNKNGEVATEHYKLK